MAEHVVIRRKLCLNRGYGDEAAGPDIHPLGNMGDIDVDIFKDRVETVLTVVHQQLAAEIPFVGGESVVGSVKRGQMVADIHMLRLHRVGQAFHVNNKLIHLEAVGVDVIGLGIVAVCRSAEVYGRLDPSIDLGAAARTIPRSH